MDRDKDDGRAAVHEAIQHNMAIGKEAILTGWVLVAEWIDCDSERYLVRGHSADLTAWHAKGMHHEALHGEWPIEGDS